MGNQNMDTSTEFMSFGCLLGDEKMPENNMVSLKEAFPQAKKSSNCLCVRFYISCKECTASKSW